MGTGGHPVPISAARDGAGPDTGSDDTDADGNGGETVAGSSRDGSNGGRIIPDSGGDGTTTGGSSSSSNNNNNNNNNNSGTGDGAREGRDGWVVNAPSRGRRALDGHELWRYRELARFLARRDLKVRYKQAAFGLAWAVVRPVAGMAVLAVVFHRVAGVPGDGLPYLPFVLVGYAAWSYFAGAVGGAAASLVANSTLITKVYFPRLLAPVAAVVPGLVDLAVSAVPLAAVMAWEGVVPTAAIVTLPLWVAGLALAALGVGLGCATLNVRYRDVGAALGLALQLWFFLTPVAYPATEVPEAWRLAYHLNPVAGIVGGLRWCLLGAPWPGLPLAVSAATALAALALGLRAFLAAERRFADVI